MVTLHPGCLRYVGEAPGALVAVQTIPIAGIGLVGQTALGHGIGEFRAVHEVQVQESVLIEVESCDTADHRLHQVLLRGCRGGVTELDARSIGYVDEFRQVRLRVLSGRETCGEQSSSKPFKYWPPSRQ